MPDRSLFEGIVLDGHIRVGPAVSEGAFGFVFQGRDEERQRDVAIKILKDGTTNHLAAAEMVNEGQLLEKLTDASNVVDLIGPPDRAGSIPATAQTPDGTDVQIKFQFPYLVLEWMDASLFELLPNRDVLPWGQRLTLVREIVKGVHQMHIHGIYHRDLKSDNVLVRLGRRTEIVVKVADLGRSRDVRDPPAGPQDAYWFGKGHLLHAPPECLWGLGIGDDPVAFRRFDLYLIGSILFELATGSSITNFAFPNPFAVVQESSTIPVTDRPVQYEASANTVRSQFAPAFTMFEESLPKPIRGEGGRLLRQLCDPRPERRDVAGNRPRLVRQPGLNWLINRMDILIKISNSQVKTLGAHGTASGAAS